MKLCIYMYNLILLSHLSREIFLQKLRKFMKMRRIYYVPYLFYEIKRQVLIGKSTETF